MTGFAAPGCAHRTPLPKPPKARCPGSMPGQRFWEKPGITRRPSALPGRRPMPLPSPGRDRSRPTTCAAACRWKIRFSPQKRCLWASVLRRTCWLQPSTTKKSKSMPGRRMAARCEASPLQRFPTCRRFTAEPRCALTAKDACGSSPWRKRWPALILRAGMCRGFRSPAQRRFQRSSRRENASMAQPVPGRTRCCSAWMPAAKSGAGIWARATAASCARMSGAAWSAVPGTGRIR